ncbi:MAG: Tim44/TimA family putative adaptor protein [Beijerinckiaceae bacterium]|nr:Tim44/TimA family putative adaptor protein [Beijerinckiaceae bacterium]
MQDSFDMTTIIFALLAAFVVWKLRSVLGTRSGTEKPPSNPFATRAQTGIPARHGEAGSQVVKLPGAAEVPVANVPAKDDRWKPYAEPGTAAWAGLDGIAATDPDFAVKPFVDGAKSAYEMIIGAFADGNRGILSNLLSPEVYEGFAAALDGREKRGEKLTTTFVSIDKVAFEDAALRGRIAKIKVHITAQMTTVTRDSNGAVIDGDPDKIVQIDDIWTFTRDTSSHDPNWKLSATESAN